MDFLVEIAVHWPSDAPAVERERLVAAEAERAAELAAAGTLVRLWRIPGRWQNVGLWRATDADELDGALRSLPFFPWLDITVRPLATHPNDPEPKDT